MNEPNMKTIVPIVFFIFLATSGFSNGRSREYERKLERAETLYRGGNYGDALTMYTELYQLDTTNYNVCYKTGVCYLKSGSDNKKALFYLKKTSAGVTSKYLEEDFKNERNAPLDAIRLLGDAYHLNYEFDAAINTLQKYKEQAKIARITDKDVIMNVDRKIEMCKTAIELMKHPAEVKIVNLGKGINSPFADYAPRISADQTTMIYTSRRPENVGGKTYDGGQYFEDIYISTRSNRDSAWSKAVNIGWPINTVSNEAAIGISADGQEILIYKDDYGDGNIYSSRLEGDKWSVPVKLNYNINSKYWEPGAFLSSDGNTLYFVSDRPGGYGGTDIYKSKKTSNGDWGKAINLGPVINSPFDEHSPYIHPDGTTLFFSSKGHQTMGGYDVFFSHLAGDGKSWAEPVNVGYPINTPGDDAFYMVSPDKQSAYYSTYSAFKNDGQGEKDNYMITFADIQASPLAVVKGAVTQAGRKPARNVVITVTNNETNEIEGVYHANSKTGNYLFILSPGTSHNIAYEADGQLFYSENRYVGKDKQFNESSRNVDLPELKIGSRVVLNNIFFDFDDTKIRPFSVTEMKRIYDFLHNNPGISVEVAGYADSKGSDEYNKKLSKERAQSVVNYLYSMGIDKRRMMAVGYGEEGANNDKNDVSGQTRDSNRRVELRIIKMN
jgi:outer membrane protein OmpA-like peptidoglycan-associated protein